MDLICKGLSSASAGTMGHWCKFGWFIALCARIFKMLSDLDDTSDQATGQWVLSLTLQHQLFLRNFGKTLPYYTIAQ